MGNLKKKKQARNVVKTDRAFKKQKVKVGKTLKRTNMTNTEVTTQKVVLLQQFFDGTAEPTSHRGLTVPQLTSRIDHPSLSNQRDAVNGLKEMLTDYPDLIETHLHSIIASVARLLANEKFIGDKHARENFKRLANVLFNVQERIIVTSLELLVTHLRIGFTKPSLPIRTFALEVALLFFDAQPSLCSQAMELRTGFLDLMRSDKRPTNKTLLARAIRLFRFVYEQPHASKSTADDYYNVFNTLDSLKWLASRTKFSSIAASVRAAPKSDDTKWLDKLIQ